MKLYIVISGIYAFVVWFFYGNYIDQLIASRSDIKDKQRDILEKLRVFSRSSTGLRFIMLEKETWEIDSMLNKYMTLYITSVLHLMCIALFLIIT
jgi:hypothetical protein